MTENSNIDPKALDSMSVAPGDPDKEGETAGKKDAGTDRSIEERLKKNPGNEQAELDEALDESMDASDPPQQTQPCDTDAPPSSGYDPEAERKREN